MVRIRERRDKPGLRPQHLQALRACAMMSSGRIEGDAVGSREIYYYPGSTLRGGKFAWEMGTAGSTTMLAFTVLPLALFADGSCNFSMGGGLFQDFAPSAFHMREVLSPQLKRMGAEVRLEMIRPGYVPEGGGRLHMRVSALDAPLRPIRLTRQGTVTEIRGIAIASHLEEEKVATRMAEQARKLLLQRGQRHAKIQTIEDSTAVQKGAALLLLAETDTGCILGADQAGKRGRRSENIAGFVVKSLTEDLEAGATTDRHVADQLILFAALAEGRSEYLIPTVTEHVRSNLWLVHKILGAKTELNGNVVRIQGIGFRAPRLTGGGRMEQ
jgi:RNA 3'-terminal phosphate cyclase (ATP)